MAEQAAQKALAIVKKLAKKEGQPIGERHLPQRWGRKWRGPPDQRSRRHRLPRGRVDALFTRSAFRFDSPATRLSLPARHPAAAAASRRQTPRRCPVQGAAAVLGPLLHLCEEGGTLPCNGGWELGALGELTQASCPAPTGPPSRRLTLFVARRRAWA